MAAPAFGAMGIGIDQFSNRETVGGLFGVISPVIDDPFVQSRRHHISFTSTPGISRAMSADDLLDQFLAEPPGQWSGAQ
jgi:hypothetical protein